MVPVLALLALTGRSPLEMIVTLRVVEVESPVTVSAAKRIRKDSSGTTFVVESAQFENDLAKELNKPKTKLLSSPAVRTLSGREAAITTTVREGERAIARTYRVMPQTAGTEIDFSYSIELESTGKEGVSTKSHSDGRFRLKPGEGVVLLSPHAKGDGRATLTYFKPERLTGKR